jgi:hypothetical protein
MILIYGHFYDGIAIYPRCTMNELMNSILCWEVMSLFLNVQALKRWMFHVSHKNEWENVNSGQNCLRREWSFSFKGQGWDSYSSWHVSLTEVFFWFCRFVELFAQFVELCFWKRTGRIPFYNNCWFVICPMGNDLNRLFSVFKMIERFRFIIVFISFHLVNPKKRSY